MFGGIFNKIIGSFTGIIIGVVAIVAGISLLYYNDGRENPFKVAEKSVAVSSSDNPNDYNSEFISVSGDLVSDPLSDNLFLNADQYLAIKREVEVYVITEEENSQGSDGQVSYTYTNSWEGEIPSLNSTPTGSVTQNPAQKPFEDDTFVSSVASIGNFSFDPDDLKLRGYEDLELNTNLVNTDIDFTVPNTSNNSPQNLDLDPTDNPTDNIVFVNKEYVYSSSRAVSNPQVGDFRVGYSVIPSDTFATIFGKVQSQEIIPYKDAKSGITVDSFFLTDREEALSTMNGEFKTSRWVLRFVGFLIIWFGLGMLFKPITNLADIIPFVGSLVKGAVAIVTLPVALVISIATIILSLILNNIWALVVVILLAGLGLGFMIKKGKFTFLEKK